jgi:hypothetical protein
MSGSAHSKRLQIGPYCCLRRQRCSLRGKDWGESDLTLSLAKPQQRSGGFALQSYSPMYARRKPLRPRATSSGEGADAIPDRINAGLLQYRLVTAELKTC